MTTRLPLWSLKIKFIVQSPAQQLVLCEAVDPYFCMTAVFSGHLVLEYFHRDWKLSQDRDLMQTMDSQGKHL